MTYINNLFFKNDYSSINKILKKKISVNISIKNIKQMNKIIKLNKHMMLSYKCNKSLNEKKNIYFSLLKNNDALSLSIASAYTIYFIILGSFLDNICIMNKEIRINNNYNDKKICYNFKLIENLELQDINYKYFFNNNILMKKDYIEKEVLQKKYKKMLLKSFFNKLEVN